MLKSSIYGIKNENDIIKYLDGKAYKELNEKWKNHMRLMFSFVEEGDLISCQHYEDEKGKPDIVITVRHTSVYVSIKTGKHCSMHCEPLETFEAFLRKKGVSEKTIKTIRFFHYGETEKLSNNGKPFTPRELKDKYGRYFVEASKTLDKDEVIDAIVFRCVLKGCNLKRYKVNFLYYGNLEHGYILSEEDIYSLVRQYRQHDKTAIHFGGLNYHPSGRDRSKLSFHDCRIRWPILALLYYRTDEEIKDIVSGKLRV